MPTENDPRVFFAAERTLLAWLRTGIAVMGLGFLVARFGLFLALMRGGESGGHIVSTTIGVSLVILGAAMIAASSWQHRRFIVRLPVELRPQHYSTRLSIWIAACVAAAGVALAVYLLVSAEHLETRSSPAVETPEQSPAA